MGYLHIDNLYKNQTILAEKECYALEKIHGTSAHVAFDGTSLRFFSGGEKHEAFVSLFDESVLIEKFLSLSGDFPGTLTVYGEAYGGKQQGMRETYGPTLKFVAFEVKQADKWLPVPVAAAICSCLGIEFVYYEKIPTDLRVIDAHRDMDSTQAIRNGIGPGKMREGVVLKPIEEKVDHRGNRVIAKHKRDEFRETKSPRVVTEVPTEIIDAQKAADEWVTEMRLTHVLDKIPGHSIQQMTTIIAAMVEDVLREGAGEVVDTPALRKALSRKTAVTYKAYLQNNLLRVALP